MKPVIGIPMGDPSGIGPEIIIKAFQNGEIFDKCCPVVIGDVATLKRARDIVEANVVQTKRTVINKVELPSNGFYKKGYIDVVQCGQPDCEKFIFGRVCAESGKYAFDCIKLVTELSLKGDIHAIATTPINKEAIKAAQVDFIGHTEMLAGLTDTDDPLTMFQVRNMRVFFLSRHVSLRKSCDMVTKERLVDYIERCCQAMDMLGIEAGKLAVAGLNPHNGEHGLFGDEEGREVDPAIEQMQNAGFNVVGPVPGDSVFHQALQGKYDAVLSLYHDQGHIATKTVDFERTISLTIGLPFLRTSVDHGTAFDIAGKGLASGISMKEAILMAADYAPYYNKYLN